MSAPVEALESLSVTPHVRFVEVVETIPVTVLAKQASQSLETSSYGIDCAGNRIKLPTLVSPQFATPQ